MKTYLVLCLTLTLIACGPSQEEKEKIASVSCAVMEETRNMDAAIRVREMNAAREKIGGEPFLRGDDVIKEAIGYGLCEALVLNLYDEIFDAVRERKWERERIAEEKQRKKYRITEEKRLEKQRIADSKPRVEELFHPNGEKKERTNYQSKDDGGKKHGFSRKWFADGQLEWETAYKNGEQHGISRRWHENGQLEYETTFKNGERHGLNRQWHENGQLEWETTFNNGEKHGFDRWWNENGQLRRERCFSNGEEVDMTNCQG